MEVASIVSRMIYQRHKIEGFNGFRCDRKLSEDAKRRDKKIRLAKRRSTMRGREEDERGRGRFSLGKRGRNANQSSVETEFITSQSTTESSTNGKLCTIPK